VQDRCTDWGEHTIGSVINLGANDGTPRWWGQMEAHFGLSGDSANLNTR
jgi:hypothetical protein